MILTTDKVNVTLSAQEVEDLHQIGNLFIPIDNQGNRVDLDTTDFPSRDQLRLNSLYVSLTSPWETKGKYKFRHPYGDWYYSD